jgi:hypothetical protein
MIQTYSRHQAAKEGDRPRISPSVGVSPPRGRSRYLPGRRGQTLEVEGARTTAMNAND